MLTAYLNQADKAIKQPIKDHPFFSTIDWGLLEEGSNIL